MAFINEQKHPLAKYQGAFNKNSINLTAFNIRHKSELNILIDKNKYNHSEIELTFETYNDKATNPDTLFFLMLDALFAERYNMGIKEFENTYPEVVI